MSTRTKQETVTFRHPFTISGVDGVQPAGSYIVWIEEEVLDGLSFLAYRRVGTSMLLPLHPSCPPGRARPAMDGTGTVARDVGPEVGSFLVPRARILV